MFLPSYIKLYSTGELQKRIDALNKILEDCHLCPRNCRVNRFKNEKGVCRVGSLPIVSSFHAHFGEERPLVGYYGSGTIINIMYQHRPCCKAFEHPPMDRRITKEEFDEAISIAMEEGLERLDGFV